LLDGVPDEPALAAAELPPVVDSDAAPSLLPPAPLRLLPPALPAAAVAGSLVVVVPAVAVPLVLAALASVAS